MNVLTENDKNTCSYAGFFGILISVTCLIQNFVFFRPHWFTTILIIIFLFSIVAFSLLIAQHTIAPLLLAISTGLLAGSSLLLLLSIIISPIVIILFIYSLIIMVIVYANGFPAKFRQKKLAAREEQELWKNKI